MKKIQQENSAHTSSSAHWNGEIAFGVKLHFPVQAFQKPLIMAGPCMFESWELGLKVGTFLKERCQELGFAYVFKSSFDKANRTNPSSKRGPGVEKGLEWLAQIRQTLQVPVLTDVHTPEQALAVAPYVDILQVPAFLFQQRELLAACASTGKVVQIKKGQWASYEDMIGVAAYIESLGNPKVILVERGTLFGYNNLVVDYRNMVEMGASGRAVVFDGTHACQLPSAKDGVSSGLRDMAAPLIRAAVAVGVSGVFMEVHENPDQALSDADTQITMETSAQILKELALCSKFK